MKKDVLFMCQFFHPEYISSAVLPSETAFDLVRSGFKVGALCGYPHEYGLGENPPKQEVVDGVFIERVQYRDFDKSKFYGRLLNYFSFTGKMLLNIRKIKNYKTVIVYSNPPVLPLVAALANILYRTKIIFVSYDIYPEIAIETKVISETSIISRMMTFINNRVFKRLSRVIALSTEMKDYIEKNRSIPSDKIEVIPNWDNERTLKEKENVDNSLFNHLLDEKKTIISYFGNMGTAQDMETILSAIRRLKGNNDIHFLLAGHGNKMELLKEKVNSEKLENVTIYEFLHGEDFADALAITDGFIISLVEGLTGLCVPSKTYSYLAAGKPVITIMDSVCDITEDLLQYQAGFSIKNGESEKMAEIILKLTDDKLVSDMGANSKKLFLEKYTRQINTEKYARVLKEVLEEI